MKILRYLLPSLLPLALMTSAPAQDCGSGCCESGATAQKACSLKGDAKKVDAKGPVAVFKKLDAADQKAVAAAFARLDSNCPYGSRLGKTVGMLDKLYAAAAEDLGKVARHENCDPALAKDLRAEIQVIGNLRAINAKSLQASRVILAANRSAKAAKAKGGCCGDCSGMEGKMTKTSSLPVSAKTLAASWRRAAKDLATLDAKKRQQLQADLALIESKGLQMPKMVMASMKAQVDQIAKVHAGLSCSKSGLVKKHEKLITEGSYTSQACKASGQALAAASALLKATNLALHPTKAGSAGKAGAKTEEGCCDSAKTKVIGQ